MPEAALQVPSTLKVKHDCSCSSLACLARPSCLPCPALYIIPRRRMLQLLHERKVKRVVLMSDGRTAIVEVPVENTESDFMTQTYDRRDLRWAGGGCCCCCQLRGGVLLAGEGQCCCCRRFMAENHSAHSAHNAVATHELLVWSPSPRPPLTCTAFPPCCTALQRAIRGRGA